MNRLFDKFKSFFARGGFTSAEVVGGNGEVKFYSQKGQDEWVLGEVMDNKKNGYFLDLAAANGVLHSNTLAMEESFGWSGLCIEPNPKFYEELQANRSCETNSSVISDQEEEIDFRIDNGQLGGVVAKDTDNSFDVRGDELAEATIISLKAKTINKVLSEHEAPEWIDYFSLDVEGCEERIITTLDFDAYKFRCVTIERPTPLVNEVLFKNGYVFVKNYKFDSFYVHSSMLEEVDVLCEDFQQIPAKDW